VPITTEQPYIGGIISGKIQVEMWHHSFLSLVFSESHFTCIIEARKKMFQVSSESDFLVAQEDPGTYVQLAWQGSI